MWPPTGRRSVAARGRGEGKLYLRFPVLTEIVMQRNWWSVGLLAVLPWLSGCLYHTHKVTQPAQAGAALNASVAQLVNGIDDRYNAIQTLNATVDFAATTGGAKQGKQTDITPFRGYILMRKPSMLRVLGLLPLVHTRAFDLASDGSTFKLLIPPRGRAVEGSNAVTKLSANPLENLRPMIFLDSILVKSVPPEELVYLTSTAELDTVGKQQVETPEYELHIIEETPHNGEKLQMRAVQATRVIRFSRVTLLPVAQDIYDASGEVETHVEYAPYKDFGTVRLPGKIVIQRPRDSYQITITLLKVTVNQTLTDDQFEVKIPAGYQVQTLK
jgi:Domain of unknown function (DUF4292)